MYLPTTILLTLFAFLPSTLAADQSITKFSYCFTKSGTKSIKPVPTTTKSSVNTCQITKKTTIYPTKTVTPKPWTKTKRTTSTSVITKTAPQKTDLYTSTRTGEVVITESTTTTFTTVIVEATTTTVFPSGETTTVNPSPGFTPAASGPIRPRDIQIRGQSYPEIGLEPRDRQPKPTRCEFHDGKPTFYPTKLYPEAVTCTKSVKVLHTQTKTATARRTITTYLHPSTVTQTLTAVRKTTTTVFPVHATSTVFEDTTTTRTTTLIESTTISETVTNTVTFESAPTSTRYAVCERIAIDNVVFTSIAGTDGSFFGLGPGSEASAYECCAACERNSECRATAYIASISYCQGVRFPGGCNGAQVVVEAGSGAGGGIGVSAGSCGGVGRSS